MLLQTVGLGYRRGLADAFDAAPTSGFDFIEVAPENWMEIGGVWRKRLAAVAERWPVMAHGLSLSIGGPDTLDIDFVKRVKAFLDQYKIASYTEHLSYCSAGGQLYDLMPIPFTTEAVRHVAARVKQVQEILERKIALENISFYAMPEGEMTEVEFILAVLHEAQCDLLLDVNNVYVNSVNHGQYSPTEFIAAMPTDKVRCYHVAGHNQESEDLIIDTHGAAVVPSVWQVLDEAYKVHGTRPTLIERDFDFPPFAELLAEAAQVRQLQQKGRVAA
jgi:uncharacterized protein (UPF0276 family)